LLKTLYTTDRVNPRIEQYYYPVSAMSRAIVEKEANDFLLKNNKSAYEQDEDKLWRDMSLLSIVLYLWMDQHDWQVAREGFKGDFERYRYLSKPDEPSDCTRISYTQWEALLRAAGNAFAGFKPSGVFDYMCLPPKSVLSATSTSVKIATPFCELSYEIDPLMVEAINTKPYSSGEMPLVREGLPRFTTRTGIIRTRIKYRGLRAQSRTLQIYQAWASEVLDRSSAWFETEISGKNYLKTDFE
jgi:hypothetical protein